jgi:hypothetical protein
MDSNDKKIRASLIIEAIGRPPEYLTETLNSLIKEMGTEKGVKIINSTLNPPVILKNQKDFYSSFAEIEVELDHILNIAILMFKYMPAHVEVISPQNLSISNSDLGDLFSELTRRLHGYEELARMMQNEKQILETKLREVLHSKVELIENSAKSQVKEEPEKEKKVKKK